jgi:hypothetical protein
VIASGILYVWLSILYVPAFVLSFPFLSFSFPSYRPTAQEGTAGWHYQHHNGRQDAAIPLLARGYGGQHDWQEAQADQPSAAAIEMCATARHPNIVPVFLCSCLSLLRAAVEAFPVRHVLPFLFLTHTNSNAIAAWARFEATERRAVSPADGDALHALSLAICHEEKLDPARAVEDAARAYAEHPGEMPAVAAVVGGVVANDVLKAVSGKGDPHVQNLFMFSLVDTGGYVDRLGFSS